MDLTWLKLDGNGLVTVVAQDRLSGAVRMVAHANAEAVEATLHTGVAHFFSRSRQKLWKKGEESGHFLQVHEVWADCDADCLIYLVDPDGPSCHTGRQTCFFVRLDAQGAPEEQTTTHAVPTFDRLWSALEERRNQTSDQSYTRSLLDKGAAKVAEKIREEGDELARAVESESDDRVVNEAADVVYHTLVGLLFRHVTLRDVVRELARRFGVSGHVEKAARRPD
jgi:phosphoribosyl-ATP pyrophosphohydrolase/phosphoribosyl-AMP cyclohydrolase